jgi:phospholipid/cholesterol/gamma-HCH transport system substrate-binding protein
VQSVNRLKSPRLWGTAALALLTVLGLVAALVYANPLGAKLVTFYTQDASSLVPGMSVRIAGVDVGKVKDLSFEPDQVRVEATVDRSAFVGDQSQVEIRMLTVVGGFYVTIDSLGDSPLGDQAIPVQRVTPPYSLIRALADTTKITEQVRPQPVNETLNQIQQGLSGPNLEAVSALVDAGTSLTRTLDRQRGQVTEILQVADEYTGRLNGYRDQLVQLIGKIAILQQTLVLYGKGFATATEGIGRIIQALDPVGKFYWNHRDKFLAKLVHWKDIAKSFADRAGYITRVLRRVRERTEAALGRQNAPPELLATDVCIPVPNGPC